ncbi:MAG: hypothetical protein ABH828_03960 [archaeon]
MALNLTLPFGKEDNVKNLVFTILTKEYPLKIIELTNFIRKRYGKGVTFQAVRKAILELVEEGVLLKEGKEFLINKKWVIQSKKELDNLYETLNKEKQTQSVDSISGDVSVFTFSNITKLMAFWQEIIDVWFKDFKKGDPNVNCYQAFHIWEVISHPEKEMQVMVKLKKKGIKSYAITTGTTMLDKSVFKSYKKIGINVGVSSSSSTFDKSYCVGTYGDMIIQTMYPKKFVKKIDDFFKKNKSLEYLDVTELINIVNEPVEVKLTVIKNLEMAKQINKSIISQIE